MQQPQYRFKPYEGQEPDTSIGMFFMPTHQTDDQIGPHRNGTGVILFRGSEGAEIVSSYGKRAPFNQADVQALWDASAGLIIPQ